jgi:hypothetical protein
MSTLAVNTITNAAGGNTAQINGMTPTADSLQGFRNRIINGDMRIDQRNAGASVTINSSVGAYSVDRWFSRGADSAGVFTLQQVSDAPSGFKTSLKATVTTTAASPGATDFYGIQQRIEGFNIADLGYGTASSQPVTVSFWVKSSVTGTFSVALSNNNDQTIPVTFVVNAANTWEQKTVTIAGTSAGTWTSTNATGLLIQFTLGAGSSRTGTANTWSTSFFVNATGATNLMATNAATFYITGVQLEAGSVATPFERRDYGRELILCQRYFQAVVINTYCYAGNTFDVGDARTTIPLSVSMRTQPTGISITGTVQFCSPGGSGVGSVAFSNATVNQVSILSTGSSEFASAGGSSALRGTGTVQVSTEL